MKSTSRQRYAKRIAGEAKEAATLLHGLEAQRKELGSVADELITLLREAGVPAKGQSASRCK